jgi:hypothetical protein
MRIEGVARRARHTLNRGAHERAGAATKRNLRVSGRVYALDAQWRVAAFNEAAVTYVGFPLTGDQVIGKSNWDFKVLFMTGSARADGETSDALCAHAVVLQKHFTVDRWPLK